MAQFVSNDVLDAFVAAQDRPASMTVRLGSHDLDLLVAKTPRQWVRGLDGENLDEVGGMLFVMPAGSRASFHLSDCDRRLVLAFFDSNGALLEVGYLDHGRDRYQPAKRYHYVLELVTPRWTMTLMRDLVAGLDTSSIG